MSSSFVKDCSNASGSGNKTFIIIIGNETGNININENQLQSLLATHGADSSSQVSVMQMGAGGNANADSSTVVPTELTIPDTNISSMNGVQVPGLPLNFMLGGFPTSIPVEGVGGGYAELPLDADALQRLENVLHTEQAREILGEPLLDIVNDPTPNELVSQFENLMPLSDSKTDASSSNVKKKRPAPKRRSQRQMDKAEREEVEKILAENQLMLQREREELQRIQLEQEQKEERENKSEEEEEEEEEEDDDDDDDNEDDSEIESEADDVEKDSTYKIDNDLKKGKKSIKSSKVKGKVVAVKKGPGKKASVSGGKVKPKTCNDDDSEIKSEAHDVEKNSTYKVDDDLKKEKKSVKSSKGKGKVAAVKKVPVKKALISGGKGKPKSGKKGPTDDSGKEKIEKGKKTLNNGGGRVKVIGGKKGPSAGDTRKGCKKINSPNKKGKITTSKKITFATKKKMIVGRKVAPKSREKKLPTNPNSKKTIKKNQNVKENAEKEEKENAVKEEKENDKVKLKIDENKEISKVMQIKKLSVKVKKLQDNIIWNQKVIKDESPVKTQVAVEEGEKSLQGIESVLGIGSKMNVEMIDQFDDNERKDIKLPDPPHDQIQESTTTTTVATICPTTVSPEGAIAKEDTFIQKGSTSPHNVAIVKGKNIKNIKNLKSSLSNKVQTTVNSNDNTCNNSNSNNNNNNNHIAVSQSVKLNCRKLDTDTCDDNILSDAKSDFDSNNKCTSPILISTQNFSDEASSPISQRQADGSQARTDVKSSSSETDKTKVNSVHGMLNLICRDDSVREVSKKRNKMTNEVEILNPKEVLNSNSEIVSNNSQNEVKNNPKFDQQSPCPTGDIKDSGTNDPKFDPKSPCPTGEIKDSIPKKKSFVNELNRGTFASNKFIGNKFKKTDKKVPLYSPTIPKSLKNFKIPLKNSVGKRPPLISKLPDCKPYEHLQNSQFISHNSYRSSPLDSFSSQFIPRNLNNNINNTFSNKTLKENAHPTDSYTHVASKTSPISTDDNSKSIKNEQLSNSNFTPQRNESNKIKKSNDTILKQGQNNLDSSEVQVKNINKENINKPYQKTSISPDELPLKIKTFSGKITKMNPGETIIRRSRRPIKRKTFGDDILFLDGKPKIHRDDFEDQKSEVVSNEEAHISNDSDANDDDEGDEDSDNDVEDDDPERLWCICEKPHNNRFMICCDRCEDWFHGTCVGVTKSMGKQMEKDKIQWICPNCKKAERAIKGFSSPRKEVFKSMKNLSRSPEVQITNEIYSKKKEKLNDKMAKKQENESKPKEKTEPRVLVYEKATGIVLSGTAAPTLNILPDWLKENPAYTTLQPAMMNSIKTDPKTGLKRISLEAFGLKPYKPKLDRSFSFQEKIDSGSLGSAKKEKSKSTVKLLKHSEVLEIEKGKKAEQLEKLFKKEEGKKKKKKRFSESLSESPSPKKEKRSSIDLSDFYSSNSHKRTPGDKNSSRSNSLSEEAPPSSPNTKKPYAKDFVRDAPLTKKIALKSPEVEKTLSSKFDTSKHRDSVRNLIYEALNKRKSEVPNEFKDVTEEKLKLLCKEIEEQLFLTFNKEVNFKYKSRSRSLIFNIKDAKNGGLFRQILSRTIPPDKLANMTSEELASKELSEWREREEKKELEAIHKHELERIALGNQYIMKSHKGEIVIDKEELGAKNKDTESVISLAPDSSKAINSTPDAQEDEDSINHRNHIYNPSCKICQASELQNISKEELLEAKEKLNIEIEEEPKDDKERKKLTSLKESESSSSSSHHHHSKHRKKDRERDRSRERRHSRKSSRDKDKSDRDRDRHKDREKEKSKRHRHSSGDKDRSRRHRSRERRSRERDSNSSQDISRDGKKSEDKKRRHSESRCEDRKRVESDDDKKNFEMKEQFKDEKDKIIEKKHNTLTDIPELSMKFKESSSEDSKSPLQFSNDPIDSQPILPLDILLPPLPPIPNVKSESVVAENKICEISNRSPATPPYPVNENDIDDDDSMLSPATPPLPDDDDDRLTPPPPLPAQKPLEDVQIHIWKGVINMPDVAKFTAAAFEVSGKALFFTGDVPSMIEVVGRISPDTVWTYIAQVKKSGSKEILVVRFQPSCEAEKVSYIALYSYLSSKKRYGVIGNCEKTVKDFYVVPLASHQPIPQVLLPLDGPGFEESRPHMLIGVIIRSKHKRIYDPLAGTWTNLVEQPSHRLSQDEKETFDVNDERSYTPPPTNVPKPSTKKRKPSFGDDENEDNDGVFTPSPISAEDGALDLPPEKEKLPTLINSSKSERESMLAELNRQIERDRKELSEMQKKIDKKMEENEKKIEEKDDNTITIIDDDNQDSVVTNSDVGGPEGSQEPFVSTPLDTSKISIPSNLHEILASIKEKEKAIAEKENEIKRRLNMPEETSDTISSSKDVDLRLLLGTGKDQDLRIFTSTGVPPGQSVDQDFRSRDPRDPRMPRDNRIAGVRPLSNEKGDQPSLGNLSDADPVAKVVEMERGQVFNAPNPGINPIFEHRVPPEHPSSHNMMPPPGGGPPHNMGSYPPEPNPVPPPNVPYPPHSMPPPPGYRPQGPYINPGPSPNGPPMGMIHGPPAPPFLSERPQHPPGPPVPPIPPGHPGLPVDPSCPLPYGPHRGPPSDRMPGPPDPYKEYPPYSRPPNPVDRRQHRAESERHHPRDGNSWDSRGNHRDSNNYWNSEDSWGRRGDGNRRGHSNKNSDRFSVDNKKRRWIEGGGGVGRPHYRSRWGDDDNEERSGGDRYWRNGGDKRPRRERKWYDSTDGESGQKEIDY